MKRVVCGGGVLQCAMCSECGNVAEWRAGQGQRLRFSKEPAQQQQQ